MNNKKKTNSEYLKHVKVKYALKLTKQRATTLYYNYKDFPLALKDTILYYIKNNNYNNKDSSLELNETKKNQPTN